MRLTRGGFSLVVKERLVLRGITAVFGPSGVGKSSLLRAVAGFEIPQTGRITYGDRVLFDSAAKVNAPSHKRGVGYMFQDGRLLSHLNVRGNLAFAAKRAPKNSRINMETVIEAFALLPLLGSTVSTLSGGERQRVALARSVLSCPEFLLLDEPLSAIDDKAKRDIMRFIKDLPTRFNIPVIYVSHNLDEIGALATDILILNKVTNEGQVQAYGPALEILPLCFGAQKQTWFEGTVSALDNSLRSAQISLGAREACGESWEAQSFNVPHNTGSGTQFKVGETVRLCVNADEVSLALDPPQNISIQNILQARIKAVDVADNTVLVTLTLAGGGGANEGAGEHEGLPELHARITLGALEKLRLKPGQAVWAMVKSVSLSAQFD